MLLKLVTENRERESGNECTAVTHLKIQHGPVADKGKD